MKNLNKHNIETHPSGTLLISVIFALLLCLHQERLDEGGHLIVLSIKY